MGKWWLDSGLLTLLYSLLDLAIPWNFEEMPWSDVKLGVREIIFPTITPNGHLILSLSSELV